MHRRRREALRCVAIVACTVVVTVGLAGLAAAATRLWECNYCHQQYQGDSPPRFAKCPAKDMKQNHWWIEKR